MLPLPRLGNEMGDDTNASAPAIVCIKSKVSEIERIAVADAIAKLLVLVLLLMGFWRVSVMDDE